MANKNISILWQVAEFPEEQLLVAVFPGVPTAAELFLLPYKNQSEGKKKSEEALERVWVSLSEIHEEFKFLQLDYCAYKTVTCCVL